MAKSSASAVGSPTANPYSKARSGTRTSSLTFLDFDSEELATFIEAVTLNGDCAMFARTRDGGAMCISVLHDGDTVKWYASNAEDLQAFLEDAREIISDLSH